MIRRRRSPREKLDDRASAGTGRAELPPASQAPPPVFRAPALRGVPGAGDCRRPDGSSLAGGTWRSAASDAGSGWQGGWPAAQGKRQSLHLVSGRSAPRPRGAAGAPSSAGGCGPAAGLARGCGAHAAGQRGRGGRADFAAASGGSTCAPGM